MLHWLYSIQSFPSTRLDQCNRQETATSATPSYPTKSNLINLPSLNHLSWLPLNVLPVINLFLKDTLTVSNILLSTSSKYTVDSLPTMTYTPNLFLVYITLNSLHIFPLYYTWHLKLNSIACIFTYLFFSSS